MRYPEACLKLRRNEHRCRVEEISPGAACVRPEHVEQLPEGAEVLLEIPGYGPVPAEVVRLAGDTVGLLFLHDAASRQAMQTWLSQRAQSGWAKALLH